MNKCILYPYIYVLSRLFLEYLLYLHFKCYPLSWFPLQNPHPIPLPLLLNPPTPASLPLHWGIETSQDQGPLLSLTSNKAILCYICGWSHGSFHVYSLLVV